MVNMPRSPVASANSSRRRPHYARSYYRNLLLVLERRNLQHGSRNLQEREETREVRRMDCEHPVAETVRGAGSVMSGLLRGNRPGMVRSSC